MNRIVLSVLGWACRLPLLTYAAFFVIRVS